MHNQGPYTISNIQLPADTRFTNMQFTTLNADTPNNLKTFMKLQRKLTLHTYFLTKIAYVIQYFVIYMVVLPWQLRELPFSENLKIHIENYGCDD